MERARGVPKGLGRAQAAGKAATGWAFRWYAGLRVRGAHNVPSHGPAVLAANHRSMLDVPLLVVACPRPVYFVAKAGLFASPLLSRLFHALGGFPISPHLPDHGALATALAVLESGNVVGIYPEGTRSKTGEMLPFLKGAAWLSLRTGAPIVPCGIVGTAGWGGSWLRQMRKEVAITFGTPLDVQRETDPVVRRREAERLTQVLLAEVTKLAA